MGNSADIVVIAGLFDAQSTTTFNAVGSLVVQGGEFRANGALLMDSSSDIFLTGGLINALDTTTISFLSTLNVEGGEYRATGAVLADGTSSEINVLGGVFNALSTTTLNDAAEMLIANTGVYNATGTTTLNGTSILTVANGGTYTGGDIIANGGRVQGTSQITANIINDTGRVAPGVNPNPDGSGAIGTLNQTGTYTQNTGGTFVADIEPGGTGDLLNITGPVANLQGNITVNAFAGTYTGGTQIRIIASNAPIPTIFDTATLQGDGAANLIVWVGRVDNGGTFDPATGNNVDLIVASTAPAAERPDPQPAGGRHLSRHQWAGARRHDRDRGPGGAGDRHDADLGEQSQRARSDRRRGERRVHHLGLRHRAPVRQLRRPADAHGALFGDGGKAAARTPTATATFGCWRTTPTGRRV